VDNATLTRFFAFHFLFPFVIAGATVLHSFHPYFSYKDLLGFVLMLLALTSLTLFAPSLLGDPENFTPANPLVTPPHIQPE